MEATVRATCPNCRSVLRIPADWVGQAVKCKKCGTVFRSRVRGEDAATAAPPPSATTDNQPDLSAFDFSKPSPEDECFFSPGSSQPAPAIGYQPPAGPDPGSPPTVPGYAGGYPYLPPPGYPAAGSYVPPGYPYPPGLAYPPPPGYPAPVSGTFPAYPGAGYVPPYGMPPPGYPYPYPTPAAVPPPPSEILPAQPAPSALTTPPAGQTPSQPGPAATGSIPSEPAGPRTGTHGTVLTSSPSPSGPPSAILRPGAPSRPAPPAQPPAATATPKTGQQPASSAAGTATAAGRIQPTSTGSAPPYGPASADLAPPASAGRRSRRSSTTSSIVSLIVIAVVLGGLVTGGILGARYLNEQHAQQVAGRGKKQAEADAGGGTPTVPAAKPAGFPRRMLFIHISRYMYLNPLTYAQQTAGSIGEDRTKGMALRLAYEWQVPSDPKDPDRNQLFILSDTARPDNPRAVETVNPMRNVVMGAYERFFATSRPQDRIVVYFGGHVLEIDDTVYLAPIEGDPDDPETSLIPLADFYDKLKACKATQKVVIWDVCRYNPQRGKQRPGSEPMSETIHAALIAAPPGVEVITTCQPGENALEFFNLQTEADINAPKYAGSLFLEAAKHVAAKNVRVAKRPTPADPIPVVDWATAVSKRVAEMTASPVVGQKQTVALYGEMSKNQVAYNPEEPPAKRFEFPTAPKGIPAAEVAKIADEFIVPPIKSDLTDTSLTEIAFREEVMKDYMADISVADVARDPATYRFQATTLKVIDKIRKMWTTTPGTSGGPQLRESFKAPVNDQLKREIKDEQDFWAVGIAELELLNLEIDGIAALREQQSKRWQANYDYARAALKARLAFMNEYNKLLGDVLTETLPPLDMSLGQDTYKLASSERMKSRREVQKLAEEAKELYAQLIAEHKGTPWAVQAKRDKSFALGLVWQPISSGDVGKDD